MSSASSLDQQDGELPDASTDGSPAVWPLVVVTTFFPSSVDPQRTVFVKNLVMAMRARRDVTVISPVPRRPWPAVWSRALPQPDEVVEGIHVAHPRFLVMPGLGWLTALSYFVSVVGVLSKLRRQRGRFVLHAHCAYPDGVGVAMAARWLNMPCVVTAHGSDINVYSTLPTLRPQMAWALKRVSALVAVSRALEAKLAVLVGDTNAERACIPCAGFDPEVFAPRDRQAARERLGLHSSARVAVFIGQLVPVKQVDRLIEAWGQLHWHGELQEFDQLIIIGAGPKGSELKRQVTALGVNRSVVFTGAVVQAEIPTWLGAADLLCLPSRDEGLPNVVVEALASGVPVVASRVGGIPELIQDGVNGLLVSPSDSAALAQALHRCFGASWHKATLRKSVEHLTWSAIARRNLELIDRITAKVDHASMD